MIKRLIDKIGRKLLGNSMWLFIDKLVRLFVGLFVGVLVARYLGPEKMGIWNYCIAIFTFFIVFPSLGLEYIGPREFVNRSGEEEKLLNTSIVLKFIGATLGIVFAVLFMGFFKGFSSYLIPLIFILTSGYLFQSLDVIDYYYQSKLEQKKSVIARMIAFVLVSLYKLYLVQSGAPLIWFVASSTIDFGLGAIGLIYSLKKSPIQLKLKTFDWELAKALLKDSLVFSISALVIVIYYKIDQIMVTEILGEQENGIYSIAIRIYELFTLLPAVLVSSFLPVLTQNYKKNGLEFKASLKQLYSIVTYLALIFTIGVWFFGPWVMNLLYGEAYEGSGEVLQIIGLGFYFVFIGMATGSYLIVRNLKKFIFFKSIIGLGLNIGLNLWLIPKMGIIGAAIASMVSNFVSTFLILALKDNHSQLELILSPFNLSSIRRFLKY
ncbi:MAG: flippase [Flavobacteriales bacterium]|nr:flippase [Flavobacteriales bacterium]